MTKKVTSDHEKRQKRIIPAFLMACLTILAFLFYTTGYPGLVKIPPKMGKGI
jgi:hypothetical protein